MHSVRDDLARRNSHRSLQRPCVHSLKTTLQGSMPPTGEQPRSFSRDACLQSVTTCAIKTQCILSRQLPSDTACCEKDCRAFIDGMTSCRRHEVGEMPRLDTRLKYPSIHIFINLGLKGICSCNALLISCHSAPQALR